MTRLPRLAERGQTVLSKLSLTTVLTVTTLVLTGGSVLAANPPPPVINTITTSNGQMRINWIPSPAAQQYKMFRADDLSQPWVEDVSGSVNGFDWFAPLGSGVGFQRLQVVPMSDTDLLIANVLNRIAYGPTPDELERVRAMG